MLGAVFRMCLFGGFVLCAFVITREENTRYPWNYSLDSNMRQLDQTFHFIWAIPMYSQKQNFPTDPHIHYWKGIEIFIYKYSIFWP